MNDISSESTGLLPSAAVSEGSGFLDKIMLLPLCLIAVAYCGWILWLPLFPTHDGPVHLLFARVLEGLLFHHAPGIFPLFYTVKHVLPPYSLYYYLLILLSHLVSMVNADKLILCGYVLTFLFGVRFLARSIGPLGSTMALLAAPLVLNWPLFMGFVNFCLSTAFAMWALGLWCRVRQRPFASGNTKRLAGFVVLCFVMVLTHPVPFLLVLVFCIADLSIRLIQQRSRVQTAPSASAQVNKDSNAGFPVAVIRGQLGSLLALLIAGSALLYIKAFTTNHIFRQIDAGQSTYLRDITAQAPQLVLLRTVIPFAGRTVLDIVYRLLFYLFLVVPLYLALRTLRASWRAGKLRAWRLADTWAALCLLLIVAIPVLPPDLNNSRCFASRLVLFVWLAALLAASGADLPGFLLRTSRPATISAVLPDDARRSRFSMLIAASAVAMTGLVLLLATLRIRPIAVHMAQANEVSLPAKSKVILELTAPDYGGTSALTFDPYYYGGSHIARRTDSVVYNTPWLDLAIIPIGGTARLPVEQMAPVTLEDMLIMRSVLLKSVAARAMVFSQVDTVIINRGVANPSPTLDPVLTEDPMPEHHWICSPGRIYTVCTLTQPAGS